MKGKLLIVTVTTSIILVFLAGNACHSNDPNKKSYGEQLGNALDQAHEMDLKVTFANLNSALNLYFAAHNEYPENLDLLCPEQLPNSESLNDPWGTRIKLETDSEMNLTLISAGKDKTFDTADDIKRRME